MGVKNLIKRMLHMQSDQEATMKLCYERGFTSGKDFYYSGGYPVDANFPWLISVGDNVRLSSDVRLLAHDASTVKTGAHTKIGIVKIGNNVFIGCDTVVLCNTRIGDNVIIGAHSLVTGDVPSNSVYAGNPAKFICTFEEFQQRHRAKREKHPTFGQYAWDEWKDTSEKERRQMREQLEKTFGYL